MKALRDFNLAAVTVGVIVLIVGLTAVVSLFFYNPIPDEQPLMVVINGASHHKPQTQAKEVIAHEVRPSGTSKGNAAGVHTEMFGTQPAALSTMRTSSDAQSLMTLSGKPSDIDSSGHPETRRSPEHPTTGVREGLRGELKGDDPSWNPHVGSHRSELVRSGVAQPGRAPLRPEMATGPAEVAGSNPAAASSALRESATQNAEEEIWQLTQSGTTSSPQRSAHAVIRSAAADASPAVSATTPSISPADCRSSYSGPDPKDPSLAAAGWRDAIAEASANAAVADRWRRSIWSGSSERWIKDAYDKALRCHGDVVAGWLEEVRFTRKPALSPLEWMCEHGLDSPLWMRKVTIRADRSADIAYTFVRVSVGQWATYGMPRLFKADVPVSALPDPHCTHCEFELEEPCLANPLRSVTWELVAPGRIEPGPREMQP